MHSASAPVDIWGIPLDLGAMNLGVDIGPEAFRYQKMVEKLRGAGLDVTDHGDLIIPPREQLKIGSHRSRYEAEIARVSAELASDTAKAIGAGRRVVALGGDHSINLGVMSGASVAVQGDIGLIYFDAHGDMNTPQTTLTGNIHGMHLAALLGFGPDALTTIHGPAPKLATDNLLHIGGSDFDAAELAFAKAQKLDCYMMLDFLTQGMAPLLAKIDALSTRVKHIWISLDLDSIDEIYAPGAGMPNKKGLLYREIVTLAEYIGRHCNVIGLDIVEYNPLQDVDHKTAELSIELAAKFLGTDYSWYANYLTRNDRER